MQTKPTRLLVVLSSLIFLYLVFSWATLEIHNSYDDGRLQKYHEEYKVSGSNKVRSKTWSARFERNDDSEVDFYAILWRFGFPGYPLAALLILMGFVTLSRTKNMVARYTSMVFILVATTLLARYIYLGVFSAAMQWG